MLVFEWRCERIINAAAQPNWNVQKVGWGMVGFVSNADSVVVDSGQKKSANRDVVCAFQHRSEKATTLGPAGESAESDRPMGGLRPGLVHQLKRGADQRHTPRFRVFPGSNRGVGRQHNPAFCKT